MEPDPALIRAGLLQQISVFVQDFFPIAGRQHARGSWRGCLTGGRGWRPADLNRRNRSRLVLKRGQRSCLPVALSSIRIETHAVKCYSV